jgi:hypothetical protein
MQTRTTVQKHSQSNTSSENANMWAARRQQQTVIRFFLLRPTSAIANQTRNCASSWKVWEQNHSRISHQRSKLPHLTIIKKYEAPSFPESGYAYQVRQVTKIGKLTVLFSPDKDTNLHIAIIQKQKSRCPELKGVRTAVAVQFLHVTQHYIRTKTRLTSNG